MFKRNKPADVSLEDKIKQLEIENKMLSDLLAEEKLFRTNSLETYKKKLIELDEAVSQAHKEHKEAEKYRREYLKAYLEICKLKSKYQDAVDFSIKQTKKKLGDLK